MDIIYIRFRVIGKSDGLAGLIFKNVSFSCIFVWNIAELAIVPTTCRIQPVSSAKSTDLET
jgi:hypothetical protein